MIQVKEDFDSELGAYHTNHERVFCDPLGSWIVFDGDRKLLFHSGRAAEVVATILDERDALADELEESESRACELEDRVEDLESEVFDLNATIENRDEKIDELQSEIEDLHERLDSASD